MTYRGILPLLLLMALACGETSAEPGASSDACPGGAAPMLSECSGGYFHADCGGDGEPTLACSHGHCMWFENGCPARDYLPIDCPMGDPFCVETGDGHWPYADLSEPSSTPGTAPMCDRLALIGDSVMTMESAWVIDVDIDPTLAAPASAAADCDFSVCDEWGTLAPLNTFPTGRDTELIQLRPSAALHGHTILLEVHADGARARAYVLRFTDFWPHGYSCTQFTETDRPIVTGGTLTLDAPSGPTADRHGTATLQTDAGPIDLVF